MSSQLLELVESYELLGEKRYRFKVKGLNVIINVSADNTTDALKKAYKILKELELDKRALSKD
ncbi:MAG: hypothetical protein ABWW69_07340 [Pyrodictiaceae archaeon]